jgi:hypothetical protein
MPANEKDMSRRDFVADASKLAIGAVVAPHLSSTAAESRRRAGRADSLKPSSRAKRLTVLATESFTAADNTAITARPCDTGQSWIKTSDSDAQNIVIVGNQAQLAGLCGAAFSRYTFNVSLGSPDYVLRATVRTITDYQDSYMALFLRSSGNDYYELRRDPHEFDWYIGRNSGGVETVLKRTSGIPASTTYPVNVSFSVAAGTDGSVDLVGTIEIPAYGISTTISISDTDASRILATGLPGIGIAEFEVEPLHAWDDIAVEGTAGTVYAAPDLFSMDFETMTQSGPANFTGSPNGQTLSDPYDSTDISIISDPTPRASGKVAKMVYGAGFGSDDKFLGYYGLSARPYGSHLWIRGKLFLETGTGAYSTADNRKLIRINNSFSAGLNGQDVILHRVDANNLRYDSQQFVNGAQGPGANLAGYTGADIPNDTWTTIEVHLRMSSGKNVIDGLLEVYINGASSPVLSLTSSMDFGLAETTTDAGVPIVAWGDQITSYGTGYLDTRYWDDLAISTTRIGL